VTYVGPDGLYVGSDTDWIGDHKYRRNKIAFFPFAGGRTLAPNSTGELPGSLMMIGRVAGGLISGLSMTDATTLPDVATASVSIPAPGFSPASVDGAFYVNKTMYYFGPSASGGDNSKIHARKFDGSAFGPEIALDPYHDPAWENVKTGTTISGPDGLYYRGIRSNILDGESNSIQSMFYWNGRVYYSLKGQPALYYRYFEPDTGAFGADRFTVPGIDLSSAHGMFLSGDTIYWTYQQTPGWKPNDPAPLMATPFNSGAPDGSKTVTAITVPVGGIGGWGFQADGMFVM
jgi:hypothetical protein